MKQHQYQISVQHLADAQGNPSSYTEKLEFSTGNHDDIFVVLERLQQAAFFDENTTKSFAVGLKLFGEVMLEQRDHPLFAEFKPHFMQFMKTLKKSAAKSD